MKVIGEWLALAFASLTAVASDLVTGRHFRQ